MTTLESLAACPGFLQGSGGEDGSRTVTFPDGHQECRRADHTLAWDMRDGVTTTYGADGHTRVQQTTLSGVTVTFLQDRSRVIDLPNEYRVTISADHNVVSAIDTVTGTSAVARVVDEAGTVDFATGWRLEEDLTWDTLYGPFHPKTRLHRDNRADFRTWDGAVVCRDQAGHPTAIELPDGSPLDVVRAVLQDDGTWVATRSNGDVHRYAPDGSFRVKSQSPAQGDALTAGSSAVFTEC